VSATWADVDADGIEDSCAGDSAADDATAES